MSVLGFIKTVFQSNNAVALNSWIKTELRLAYSEDTMLLPNVIIVVREFLSQSKMRMSSGMSGSSVAWADPSYYSPSDIY